MQVLCRYKRRCRPGPPTRRIKLQNEQGGAVPGCVSSLSLAKRGGFEPARSVSLHQLGNPGSSREPSNLLLSSIFFDNAGENRSHWAQTLGECRKGNNLEIIVQVYIKDLPSSSVTFLIHRFCRTRVSLSDYTGLSSKPGGSPGIHEWPRKCQDANEDEVNTTSSYSSVKDLLIFTMTFYTKKSKTNFYIARILQAS